MAVAAASLAPGPALAQTAAERTKEATRLEFDEGKRDAAAAIYRDLAWLGLDWEKPVRRQSEHLGFYAAALERLKAMGLLYPGFLSRGEVKAQVQAHEAIGGVWPRDPDGAPLYPKQERGLDRDEALAWISEGRQHAWRLDMDKALALAPAGLGVVDAGYVG